MLTKLKFLILIPSLALVFAFNTNLANAQTPTGSSATKEELRAKISVLEEIIERARNLTKNIIAKNKDTKLNPQLERLGNILGIPKAATSTIPQGKISVDLKVNGSDGPLQLTPGKQKFTWETKNAKSCTANIESPSGQIFSTEDWKGNIKTSGKASVYTANEKEGRTVYRITCFNDIESTTDTVVLTFEYPGAGPERLKTSYDVDEDKRVFTVVKYEIKDLVDGEMIEVIPSVKNFVETGSSVGLKKSYKFNLNHYPTKEQIKAASGDKSYRFKALEQGSVTIGSCFTDCPNSVPETAFILEYTINLLDKDEKIIQTSKLSYLPGKG